MMRMRNLPIQKKLILIVLVITVPALLLFSGVFIYNDLKSVKKEMVRNLTVLASAVGANSRAALVFRDEAAAKNILSSLKNEPQIESAALFYMNDEVFVTFVPGESLPFNPPTHMRSGEYVFGDRIEIVLDIFLDRENVGKIYLQAHLQEFKIRAVNYILFMLVILLAILAVAFTATLKLQNIISKPILALARTATDISMTSNFSLRVKHDNEDEIGTLYVGFNEMLSQIEKRENELGTYRDHLEEKIVECNLTGEELKKSEESIRTILDNAFDAIITMNSEGMITNWNQRAASIFGWHANEVIGKKLVDLIIPSQYKASHTSGLARFLKTGEHEILNKQIQLTALNKNGRTFPVEIAVSAIQRDNTYTFTGIIRDITQRKQAEGELLTSRERLRNLSNRLQSAREEEKTRIAREIHDELGQALTMMKLDLSWIEKKLPAKDDAVIEKARAMKVLIEETIQIVQRISSELRPQMLDILGLCDTLKWQTKEFQKRTGIHCTLNIEPDQFPVDSERSTALFRVYQEALINVARHAEAQKVESSFRKEINTLVLEVKDNGVGMDENLVENPQSLGLIGIRERILVWRGTMQLQSILGEGTTLKVTIPIDEELPNEKK